MPVDALSALQRLEWYFHHCKLYFSHLETCIRPILKMSMVFQPIRILTMVFLPKTLYMSD
jgi:hypothetical protein